MELLLLQTRAMIMQDITLNYQISVNKNEISKFLKFCNLKTDCSCSEQETRYIKTNTTCCHLHCQLSDWAIRFILIHRDVRNATIQQWMEKVQAKGTRGSSQHQKLFFGPIDPRDSTAAVSIPTVSVPSYHTKCFSALSLKLPPFI